MSDNLQNPFVVFCSSCRRILSDSFSLQDLKHDFLIHGYCTVQPSEASYSGKDLFENCLVKDVICPCSANIGFYIVSASVLFNGYSEMFALSKSAVNSYALGSSVLKEKGLLEISEDVEKLKSLVTKIYKKIY